MGKEIIIGRDCILGTEIEMHYIDALTHNLNSKGYFYLAHEMKSWSGITLIWKRAEQIGLTGVVARIWDRLLNVLHNSGI